MTLRQFRAVFCTLLFVAPAYGAFAQTKHADSSASAKRFAQSFYDWYTPFATSDSLDRLGKISAEVPTTERPELFSPQLLAALRADFLAEANAKGDPAGIDFDPFLSGQNPCEQYKVGSISLRHKSYLAKVYPVCSGKLSDSVQVIAELQPTANGWQFINFHYPRAHTDLVRALKYWRDQRRKP